MKVKKLYIMRYILVLTIKVKNQQNNIKMNEILKMRTKQRQTQEQIKKLSNTLYCNSNYSQNHSIKLSTLDSFVYYRPDKKVKSHQTILHNKLKDPKQSKNRTTIQKVVSKQIEDGDKGKLKKKGQFAEEYRSNLLKTVYKETKTNWNKKQKQITSRRHNLQSLYSPEEPTNLKNNEKSQQENKYSYNSIIRTTSLNKYELNDPQQFQINQVPLKSRNYKIKAMNELLDLLPKINKNRQDEESDRTHIAQRRVKRQKNSLKAEKHEIKPWETFHDQFID